MSRRRRHSRKAAHKRTEAPAQPWAPPLWIIAALVAVAVALPMAGVLQNGFINYDDPLYVTENPHVLGGLSAEGFRWAWTATRASNWHPLTWLSHMLDVELYGVGWPGGHHFSSLLLHAANSALLFVVLAQMTGSRGRAVLVALLFGLHPLHVESVAWVAERKDVLSTLFFFATLWAYIRYVRQPGWGRYLAVTALLALGLMAKPMLVTLPLVLLLLDYWPLARLRGVAQWHPSMAPLQSGAWRLISEKAPLLVLVAASSVVTYLVQQAGGAMSTIERMPLDARLGNAVVTYATYLGRTIWPVELAVFYPHSRSVPPTAVWLASVAVLVVISVVAIALRRSKPYLIVGWLWYLGTLVPVIGLVQVGLQASADRYTYVPLVGILIAGVWLVADTLARFAMGHRAARLVSVLVVGLCVVLTARQIAVWRDSETLFVHALAATNVDRNYVAHHQLGAHYIEAPDPERARQHFAQAVAIEPGSMTARKGMALALRLLARPADAAAEYRAIIELVPDDGDALNDLAWLLATTADASVRDGQAALRLALEATTTPESATAARLDTLAAAYAASGDFDAALRTSDRAYAAALEEGNRDLAEVIADHRRQFAHSESLFE